ncbi:MAG TPA: anti-sigma factor [Puia sp.]|nr:anti-sigma factor [Puia sp.]
MNVQEYIESGIIESYVMGLASESERAEFERLCREYPELVTARRRFEEKLEGYASENAEVPPPDVKMKVLEAVKSFSMEPPRKPEPQPARMAVLPRLVAAASIVLLLGMGFLYYQTRQENEVLTRSNDRLKLSLDTTREILKRIADEQKDVVKNPDVTVVSMIGTQVAPRSSANVYWDSARSDVYLVVKNMPMLPSDQQYQLWALIDSKPKDLGVFDATDDKVILKMKNTQKAQAFAITIEKKGGSPSPTLQRMQSIGRTMQSQ